MIAVTASAFGDTREAASDAGCVDYLLEAGAGRIAVRRAADPPRRASSSPSRRAEPTERAGAVEHSLRLRLAVRLHEAAGIGSVTDLEALAQELAVGDAGEAALGRRIARLAAQFDFDGLRELAPAARRREGWHRDRD